MNGCLHSKLQAGLARPAQLQSLHAPREPVEPKSEIFLGHWRLPPFMQVSGPPATNNASVDLANAHQRYEFNGNEMKKKVSESW